MSSFSKIMLVKGYSLYLPQTVFVGGGGYTVFMSVRLLFHPPSVHDVLVFQYLKKAMTDFHKICQTH